MNSPDLAKRIEHTILKPETSELDIQKLCEEAIRFGFRAVCIPPCWTAHAKQLLKNHAIKIVSVIGFPLGHSLTNIKTLEAKALLDLGADELDMVMNIGFFKSNRHPEVISDIAAVVKTAKTYRKNSIIKVILETALLNATEIKIACGLAEKAGANFVKTSTGFSTSGAEVKNIQIMKQSVSPHVKIKAAGGIKDLRTVMALLDAGADVLGCSSSIQIMREAASVL